MNRNADSRWPPNRECGTGGGRLAGADAIAAGQGWGPVQLLDSDELRSVLTPEPRCTERERDGFYHTVVCLCERLTRNGVNALLADTGFWRLGKSEPR